MPENPPAGWYPDDNGSMRWWDGEKWTEHRQPSPPDEPPPSAEPAMPVAPELPKDEKKKPNAAVGCLLLIVIAVIIGVIVSLSGGDDGGSGGSPAEDKGDKIGAQVVCEDFVERQLKSPGSAEFSEEKVTGAHPEFTVKGAVDSENSFGALIRNNYTCTVTYKGNDNWNLVELTGLDN